MNKFGKRIISAALAAGTLFTVTPMPGPAYAMTIIDDAQTAVEKNIELFKKLCGQVCRYGLHRRQFQG